MPGARPAAIMAGPMRAALALALTLAALAPIGARAQSIPSRSYDASEVGGIISTAMGGDGEKHNQPSVVNGALLLAGNAKHAFWDISDPYRPRFLSAFESPHGDGEAESHQVAFHRRHDGSEWRTYAAMINGLGVELWDLSDVLDPVLLSTVAIEGVDYGDNTEAVWGVCWQGDALYVGGTSTGLHVVDTTELERPSVVARLTTDELGGVIAGPLWALGNHLVVTTPKEFAGIATVDVTDPFAPGLLASELPETDSYIGGFYGGEAYLLTPLRVYDVTSDPAAITMIGSVETPDSEYLSFGQGYAFVGSLRPNAGNYKYDLSDLTAPQMVQYVEGRTMRGELQGQFIDDQFSLPIGNLIVLSDDEVGIGSVLAVHDGQRDVRGPELMTIFPADGATNVPPSSRIFLSFTDQIELGTVDTDTIQVRPLSGPGAGEPIAGSFGHAQTVLSFWPESPLAANTSYEIVIGAGGVSDLVGNPIAETFTATFATGDTLVAPRCAITNVEPTEVGSALTLGAADAGPGATYAWTVEGETTTTDAPSLTHAFAEPARHSVRLRVTTAEGASRSCAATQVVHRPLRETPPSRSSTILVDDGRGLAFVVNPDHGSLGVIDTESLTLRFEIPTGANPRTVAQTADGRLWVAAEDEDAIVILDPDEGVELDRVALRYGAAPYGVVAVGDRVLATLQGTGEVIAIEDGAITERTALGTPGVVVPRGLAVDGDTLLVTRFRSGAEVAEVFRLSAATLALEATIPLVDDPGPDTSSSGRGVPNYLSSVAIGPDGTRAWVPGKKDNLGRGLARDGEPLDPDNTIRTTIAQIDLASDAEALEDRVDLDDHDMTVAVALSAAADLAFVVSQGSQRVDVLDAYTGRLVGGFATGLAPQGLTLDGEGRLWVQSFLSRTVEIVDVGSLLAGDDARPQPLASVGSAGEAALPPAVLLGKQIFYDGRAMSQDGYISCASCHLGGDHDGRTWDFTDRGEGLRNTIDLRGRAGTAHGPVHWSGNFDEIQDFENDMRLHFGGPGLLGDADFEATMDPLGEPKAGRSDRLDALAAYVSSLDSFPRSPFKTPEGAFTAEALEGRALFETSGCRDCHAGERLTDSALDVRHDVGTLTGASGGRLGGTLDGIDTPTLRGVWQSAPYFHDGSAATLEEAIASHGAGGVAVELTDEERRLIARFLLELDDDVLGYDACSEVEEGTPCEPADGGCGCRAPGESKSPATALGLLALALVLVRRRR